MEPAECKLRVSKGKICSFRDTTSAPTEGNSKFRPSGTLKPGYMEHSFACPHCGEEISMVLDLSVRKQTYVEDCEVCCSPIEISYTVSDEELVEFSARTLG
jgi:predicted RNA-binding Zn-ribbon protein involved in translation (DUF1610 family)